MKFSFIKCAAALLTGALLAVSCSKDYEEDIKRIEDKVNAITSTYNAEIPGVQQQIAALQELVNKYAELKAEVEKNNAALSGRIDALEASSDEFRKAIEALKLADKTFATKEELQAAIDNAAAAINAAMDKIQNEQIDPLKTQLVALQTEFNAKVKELEGVLGTINSNLVELNAFKAAVPGMIDAAIAAYDKELQVALNEMKNRIAASEAALKKLDEETIPAINDAIKKNADDLADYKKVTDETIDLMQKAIKNLADTKVDKETYNKFVDEVIARFKTNEENLNTLQNLFNAFKAQYAIDLAALKAEDARINKVLDSLEKAVNGHVADLNKAIEKALEDANDYTDAQIEALYKKLTTEYTDAIQKAYEKLEKAYMAADAALKAEIEAKLTVIDGKIAEINTKIKALEDADTALNNKIETYKKALDDKDALLDKKDAELEKAIADLNTALTTKINDLEAKVDAADKALSDRIDDVVANLKKRADSLAAKTLVLEGDVQKINGDIADINSELVTINGDIEDLQDQIDDIVDGIATLTDRLEGQIDKILGRIQSVQFVPEYSDLKMSLNVMPFVGRFDVQMPGNDNVNGRQLMAFLPVETPVTFKISPENVFANAEEVQAFVDAKLLDLSFDVVQVKTRASAAENGANVTVKKIVNFDPKTGYLTMNVVGNPRMLARYLMEGLKLDVEPYGYTSYGDGYSIPVYDNDDLRDAQFAKFTAEIYAISLEIRRNDGELPVADENEGEGEGEGQNQPAAAPAAEGEAPAQQINNIASPYVIIYPNATMSVAFPTNPYRKTGQKMRVPDVNGNQVDIDVLVPCDDQSLDLWYSATEKYPAYEKKWVNFKQVMVPYYYRTPLNNLEPAYELMLGDVIPFPITPADAQKLGYEVPDMTLRNKAAYEYYGLVNPNNSDSWGWFPKPNMTYYDTKAVISFPFFNYEGYTATLVNDKMKDDRLVMAGEKYFMAPYEEVKLKDASTKVAEDVYATVMMDANTSIVKRQNAIRWLIETGYYIDIDGFGAPSNIPFLNITGANFDNPDGVDHSKGEYASYYGYVNIVKPSVDVTATLTIDWDYALDAAGDNSRAYLADDAEPTPYAREKAILKIEDLTFLNLDGETTTTMPVFTKKDGNKEVVGYLNDAFGISLKDLWAKTPVEGTAKFEGKALDAEGAPTIGMVYMMKDATHVAANKNEANEVAIDISGFEYAYKNHKPDTLDYTWTATYDVNGIVDLNVKLIVKTVDRNREPIVIDLNDHFFDINGEEFDGKYYTYGETKDKNGVAFREGMMNGFINDLKLFDYAYLKSKYSSLPSSHTSAAQIAQYADAFYNMEKGYSYAFQVNQDWLKYCGYQTSGDLLVGFYVDPTEIKANWTSKELKDLATEAVEGNVYQKITKDGKIVIYLITKIGQLVQFNWNVGFDVPHYDFIHQYNYTYRGKSSEDGNTPVYWAQASPDYKNTWSKAAAATDDDKDNAVYKLGEYDVKHMDIYANCFNVIREDGRILDFTDDDTRFFRDNTIHIKFRYGAMADGVYAEDNALFAKPMFEAGKYVDDEMNHDYFLALDGEAPTYGRLWEDTVTFYYSSVKEYFNMIGLLSVTSGDPEDEETVDFEIPTAFETAGTIVKAALEIAKDKYAFNPNTKVQGDIPYQNFEFRQYKPFNFDRDASDLVIELKSHRDYVINLWEALAFNDVRPDFGFGKHEFEMLGYDEETGAYGWVIGNATRYSENTDEYNGFEQHSTTNADRHNPDNFIFTHALLSSPRRYIGGHWRYNSGNDTYTWINNTANESYSVTATPRPEFYDGQLTSAVAYNIKKDINVNTVNIPSDLRRRIDVDENIFTYHYASTVQFSGESSVPVSLSLKTRWQKVRPFTYNVIIKGNTQNPNIDEDEEVDEPAEGDGE